MKKKEDPDSFWRDYEEKTNEKVLANSLGRYIQGREEFDSRGWTNLWGLTIASSGGFRFHHFPQAGWFTSLTGHAGREAPKEKTFFIPKEKIISLRSIEESRWWAKIFSASAPRLIIHYQDEMENEQQLTLEVDFKIRELVTKLTELIQNNDLP